MINRRLFGLLGGAVALAPGLALAQTRRRAATPANPADKVNQWTVGLAGGNLEGAPIRFAAEIARVTDDGDDLRVLPIVTRGPTENVKSLVYLRGVDTAIINLDALDEVKDEISNIDKRITYILNLFPSELHIFVRPGIENLADLAGKRVNFNTAGTAAAYSGPLIFKRLRIVADEKFIPHPTALEQMRHGEMDAVVFVTSKPIDAFAKAKWAPGFKFLPVEYAPELQDYYLPSALTTADYPDLVQGSPVRTIAAPTILAAYNWTKGSDRYRRVARLVDHLFARIDRLQEPGFHPKWRDVNLAATIPGLARFQAAQEWLDQHGGPKISDERGERARDSTSSVPVDQERLFKEFLEWRKTRGL